MLKNDKLKCSIVVICYSFLVLFVWIIAFKAILTHKMANLTKMAKYRRDLDKKKTAIFYFANKQQPKVDVVPGHQRW